MLNVEENRLVCFRVTLPPVCIKSLIRKVIQSKIHSRQTQQEQRAKILRRERAVFDHTLQCLPLSVREGGERQGRQEALGWR